MVASACGTERGLKLFLCFENIIVLHNLFISNVQILQKDLSFILRMHVCFFIVPNLFSKHSSCFSAELHDFSMVWLSCTLLK